VKCGTCCPACRRRQQGFSRTSFALEAIPLGRKSVRRKDVPAGRARSGHGMSETKTPADKKLSVGGKTLTLKRGVEQGVVRQSFSHGRSKQVVVEKVKRRVIGGDAKAEIAPVAEAAPKRAAKPAEPKAAPLERQAAPAPK